MGYPNLGLKVQMVQPGTEKWSKYKMTKNDEKCFCTAYEGRFLPQKTEQ